MSIGHLLFGPDSGALAGLWDGGDHGEGTQTTSQTNQCHDITTYPEIGLAAGACSEMVSYWIFLPTDPKRLDQVIDPGLPTGILQPSTTTAPRSFSRTSGAERSAYVAQDPLTWGADAFYDIVEGKLEFRSHYKMSAPQTRRKIALLTTGPDPVPGRDIFVGMVSGRGIGC